MPLPRPAKHVDVLLSLSLGLVAVVVLAYVRMPDFQRAVQGIATEIEVHFFHGDIAGTMTKEEPDR
jgi:hypothetical protein